MPRSHGLMRWLPAKALAWRGLPHRMTRHGPACPGVQLLVGGTMESDDQIPRQLVAGVTAVGTSQTRTGLPLLRELAEAGQALSRRRALSSPSRWPGCWWCRSPAGGLTVSTRSGRTDLARAAAWAVQALTAAHDEPLKFFIY